MGEMLVFVVCWKKYANGHLYNDNYIVQEGLRSELMDYDTAQALVIDLNSAPTSFVYYVSTVDDFYADMPPLVPINGY